MTRRRSLGRDERGAGATEFALIAPALFGLIIGIAQLGVLFMANSGLRSAVAEGARLAAVFPRPEDGAILARVSEREFGLAAERITGPTIEHGIDASDNSFATITMSYDVPLDFIFFETRPVTLTEARRVYTQPTAGGGGGSTGSTGGSTSTSASSSTGGWGDGSSSTGSTSTGGDGSTSTTSTSSTSTTSTGGNGNGNGNGHGHGNGNGNGRGG